MRNQPSSPSEEPIAVGQRALLILASLALALLASGCVYALRGGSDPTDVKLRVQTPQPQQHIVRVALNREGADYRVGSDGRVEFTVPRFSNGCDVYVFGFIKTRDGSAEGVRLVELHRDARVLRKLSLRQIA